ncbi:VOC family protein [Kocuria rhizosphaericola]|uniref:VOC family protein n=1 Tax=Kocuria rhizosphaericola TaxID=3376284 RepID=UPI0037B2F91B
MKSWPVDAPGVPVAYKFFPRIPVADLECSRSFYQALGWRTAPGLGERRSLILDLGENFGVTLVERRPAQQAAGAGQEPADPVRTVSSSFALIVDIPEEVDALVDRAVAAGATAGDRADRGYTIERMFTDPDGQRWNIVWVDPVLRARD